MNHPEGLIVTTPSDREILMTRVFEAPPQLVFDAWTTPDLIRRWWGCGEMSMTVCEVDLRPGGAWRFVLNGPGVEVHPFKGIYREIERPNRLVYTFIYDVEFIRDFEAVETVEFVEVESGRTRLTATVLHQSREARDGHLNSGMEEGASSSYDRLASLLESLTQTVNS